MAFCGKISVLKNYQELRYIMKLVSKILVVAMLLVSLCAFASCNTPKATGELTLELSHDGTYYTVMDIGTLTAKEVVIPAEYEGIPVKAIDNCAFENCTEITKVTIPESVVYIGTFAFGGCTALQEIAVPTSVTELKDGIFSGCTSLTKVTLHDGITTMGQSVFAGCTSLKTVKLPASIKAVPGQTFKGCTALETITVPQGVEKIQTFSFSGCTSLYEIIIPASVTRIEFKTFESCSALTSIEFGGTTSDWKNIKTSPNWNIGTPAYTVYCSNGELAK